MSIALLMVMTHHNTPPVLLRNTKVSIKDPKDWKSKHNTGEQGNFCVAILTLFLMRPSCIHFAIISKKQQGMYWRGRVCNFDY